MRLRIERIEKPEEHFSHLIRQGFRSINQFRVPEVQFSCHSNFISLHKV